MDFVRGVSGPGMAGNGFSSKIMTKSGVETRIRALGTGFVAIFRFREICDVDYNLSSKNTRYGNAFLFKGLRPCSADPLTAQVDNVVGRI